MQRHGYLPGGVGGVGAHANAVVELRPVSGGSGLLFSTAGWDGRVVLWDAGQDAAAFADTIAALR